MKIKFSIMGVFMMLLFMPPNNAIAIDECETERTCLQQAQLECQQWCCPTTGYECPDGWIYSLSGEECRRATDLDSDSTGYWKQNYGTCAPSERECFRPNNSGTYTTCKYVDLTSASWCK